MIVIPVLIVAGCSGNAPANGGLAPGTRWVLRGYLSNGTLQPLLSGTTITLEFGKDNLITGSAGCNHYFADYTLHGTAVVIGQAGSTEIYCMTPGVMEQESAYLTLLGKVAAVAPGKNTLAFTDAAGITILTFAREVPPAPAPLAGMNWTLDAIYSGDTVASVAGGATITAVFDDEGRVSGSAGCNQYFGSYTVSGTSLAISSLGSTKMNCPGPGIMQQETGYLAALGKTTGYSIGGDRLTLSDASGSPLLAFTAGA